MIPPLERHVDLLTATHDEIVDVLKSCGISHEAPWIVGRCPQCGGSYVVGVNVDQPTTSRLMFHADPPCSKANDLPALGFLQWARTEGGSALQRRGGDLAKLPRT
jgi:hypothetical protein